MIILISCFKGHPSHVHTPRPMIHSRSLAASHGISSVNIVTHSRQLQGRALAFTEVFGRFASASTASMRQQVLRCNQQIERHAALVHCPININSGVFLRQRRW